MSRLRKPDWLMLEALFYGCTGLFGVIVVFFTIPEFKGRSYIEIDELFERRISARKFATTMTLQQEQHEREASQHKGTRAPLEGA